MRRRKWLLIGFGSARKCRPGERSEGFFITMVAHVEKSRIPTRKPNLYSRRMVRVYRLFQTSLMRPKTPAAEESKDWELSPMKEERTELNEVLFEAERRDEIAGVTSFFWKLA